MEWSKAKTYMIIAFAITNILLLLSIMTNRVYYSDDFDTKSLKELRLLLEKKHIKCEEKLSIKDRKLPALEITYANINKDQSLKNISEKYKDNIKIIDDMYLEIHIDNVKEKIKKLEDLEKYAENFITENFNKNHYKLKTKVDEEDYYSIDYEQIMGNVFIDEGYLKFASNDKNSVDISIFKTNAKALSKRNINIISNAQALSKVIPQLKDSDVINQISLGYARSKESMQNKDEVLRYVRLIPYWRIKINSDQYLFVEAVKIR